MSKRSKIFLLVTALVAVFAIANDSIAQNMEQVKSDYESTKQQIQDLIKQMNSLQAGEADKYDELKAQYDKLSQKKLDLENIMSGDLATKQKIAEVNKLYNDGYSALKIQRYSDALSKFTEAVAKGLALNNPLVSETIVRSYFGLGNVRYVQRNYSAMIEPLQKAVEMNPNHYGAYNLMGRSYDRQGELDNAIASYKKSVEINDSKENYRPHFNMGVTYYNKKEYDLAKEEFAHTVARNPSHAVSMLYLGMTHFELKEYRNAQTALEKSVQFDEKLWKAHFFLARVFNNTGQYRNAIASAENVLKYHPKKANFGGALLERGKAFEGLGNNARAIEDYNSALKDRDYKKNAEYQIEILTKFKKKGGVK